MMEYSQEKTVVERAQVTDIDEAVRTVYRLDDVRMRYDGRTVLQLDGLEICDGETLAVVGPSGAGKSTLLRLLALLERPSDGAVTLYLDRRVCQQQTVTNAQRRRLAMVFQQPALLSRSVFKNVAYGLQVRGAADVRERVMAALEQVQLAHLVDARAKRLSGGEQQRVALARALVLRPEVLILDEPTANLDPHNIRIIEGLLREQCEQTTVIMVTHNIFQAKRLADRVAFLLDSYLVEVAAAERFFDAPEDPRTAAFLSGDMVY